MKKYVYSVILLLTSQSIISMDIDQSVKMIFTGLNVIAITTDHCVDRRIQDLIGRNPTWSNELISHSKINSSKAWMTPVFSSFALKATQERKYILAITLTQLALGNVHSRCTDLDATIHHLRQPERERQTRMRNNQPAEAA